MRIKVEDHIEKTAYRLRVVDPQAGGITRLNKLAEIRENAVDFANDVLLAYELPSTPQVRYASIKGFEDINTPVENTAGYITVTASFTALNGHTIRLELPIPIKMGKFYVPSIVIYNQKKHILSHAFIEAILESFAGNKPVIENPLMPNPRMNHVENIDRPLFSAPRDPSGWSDLILERYV